MTDQVFDKIKESILNIDPVYWAENNLTLDGRPYKLIANGYRPIVEILRYMANKALEKDAKPMIWVKGRQISGTVTSCAAMMYFMGSGLFGNTHMPPIRIADCWPFLDHAAAFSKTKLSAMIDNSILVDDPTGKKGKRPLLRTLIDTTSASNDNQQFKQFKGGNHLWIESVGLDGGRMRGKTCDVAIFDEIQEMGKTAISNTTKILTKAQYGRTGDGVQIYFGTPKQRGSEFWHMWNKSSQQYFYLGCENCKDYFPLYTPGSNEWEKIWLHDNVVKCTHCNQEQDRLKAINRGKWVATKDAADSEFVGFHLNQLYLPEFTKEQIIAKKPENSTLNTERSYQNEVLGEFFQGDAAIITPDEIREKCGDVERKFRASVTAADELITFLGIDIGKKSDWDQLADSERVRTQGQSYSTAVVLSLTGPKRLSIEFAAKFKRNDLESKKTMVDEIIKRYNCKLTVCDIGYANDFCELLQTTYGDKFLASNSTGRMVEHIKFDNDLFPKTIIFEKDFWIMDVYEQMKQGLIRFPLGDYEKVAWLIQHCANMEIKPSISRTGEVTPHYVKSGNNDGFAALVNAYLAYRFFISQGFTIKNPLVQQSIAKQKQPVHVMAFYAPPHWKK